MESQSLLRGNERGQKRSCEWFRNSFVYSKGVLLLLVWSTVINGFWNQPILFLAYAQVNSSTATGACSTTMIAFITAVYLMYPVAGLVAEVYWTRYKVMVVGTALATFGIFIAAPSLVLLTVIYNVTDNGLNLPSVPFLVFSCVGVILYEFGLGMFSANAIQFGADQLQFPSSKKLSIFVYWYYWTTVLLAPILYGFSYGAYLWLVQFKTISPRSPIGIILIATMCCLTIAVSIIVLACFCYCLYNHLVFDPVGTTNPIRQIYVIVKFVWQNPQPLSRSAFTYGEIPSRMDYAKQRYGGPYTTEEVEDVKTFGRILLVLLALFGGMIQPQMRRQKLPVLLNAHSLMKIFFTNFSVLSYFLLFIAMPLFILVAKPLFERFSCKTTILQKMRIGLIAAVISNLLVIPAEIDINKLYINYITLVYAIASIFAYFFQVLFVHVSALEFILAQGPRSMQGLLIGLWYSYQIIEFVFFLYPLYSYKLSIIKTCLSFISLLCFLIISSQYKYRQRDEYSDINRQNIIEQYTERALEQDNHFESMNSGDML